MAKQKTEKQTTIGIRMSVAKKLDEYLSTQCYMSRKRFLENVILFFHKTGMKLEDIAVNSAPKQLELFTNETKQTEIVELTKNVGDLVGRIDNLLNVFDKPQGKNIIIKENYFDDFPWDSYRNKAAHYTDLEYWFMNTLGINSRRMFTEKLKYSLQKGYILKIRRGVYVNSSSN